tara:strand:- start:24 stop:557 length:534 start_codon:yes stop_codon:yes gene_type:complete
MLLIINLGIILSLLFIVIFDVVNLKEQIMCTILILITIIMFKMIFTKMIKSNKKNKVGVLTSNISHKISPCLNQKPSCKNFFNLKNIDLILVDLKNISRKGDEVKKDSTMLTPDNLEFIDKVNTKKNNMLLNKYSGNKDFNFKDLHNTIISKNLNTSEKGSLLLNNVDCSNDTTCIV